MLVYLGIQDLTLIENARLEMSAGLNVLSGESGAGKSVVLDALGFVAGQTRARAKVRAPAALGQVEALFELSEEDRRALAPILERLELPLDRELSLSRRIDANGRSRCFVQGSLVPARILGDIAEQLIEFSDQGDSHALRSPQAQLELLDGCAGLEPLRLAYQEPYQLWLRSTVELEEVQRRAAEAERRRDFLEFQLNELAGCAELDFARETEQLEELESAAEAARLCVELEQLLGADDGCQERLEGFRRRLAFSPLADSTLGDHLLIALDALGKLGDEARALVEVHEPSPGDLEELTERVERVRDLARKHRVAPEELAERARSLTRELDEAARADEQRLELEALVLETRQRAEALAQELHLARVAAASDLAERAAAELEGLGLPGAALSMAVEADPLGPSGASSLTIGFSSHRAAPPQPIGRIASGGELGRVLLALRLAAPGRRPLLVLDEIDAGSGGRAAECIGQSLARAAAHGQLLCVTHWPQVACRAERHLRVEKRTADDSVSSDVVQLDGEARVEELCRMLGGSSATASDHARALLAKGGAEASKNQARSPAGQKASSRQQDQRRQDQRQQAQPRQAQLQPEGAAARKKSSRRKGKLTLVAA